jgi:hypothetical protein
MGESSYDAASVHLFHYHLVTSRVREVEARYLGKLGSTSSRGTGVSATI